MASDTSIGEKTSIQMGLVVSAILFLVVSGSGAVWWASDTNARVIAIQQSVASIQADFKAFTHDRWSRADHTGYADALQKKLDETDRAMRSFESRLIVLEQRARP